MFDLKVEIDRLTIASCLNLINIVPIDLELRESKDLHTGITFCLSDNTNTDRLQNNIILLMML